MEMIPDYTLEIHSLRCNLEPEGEDIFLILGSET